eukprot:scaffold662790_cov60-Prasinocladus_malaysianus.AAC.1
MLHVIHASCIDNPSHYRLVKTTMKALYYSVKLAYSDTCVQWLLVTYSSATPTNSNSKYSAILAGS